MQVLQITPQLPWPPDNGGRMALYQEARQIGRRHRLTLLSLSDRKPEQGIGDLADFCESVITVNDRTGAVFTLLDAATSERPWAMSRFHSRALAKKAAEICENRGIDIVHFDHLQTAAYRAALPSDMPCLLREHNVESRILERYAERGAPAPLRGLARRQARAVARYESIACARFDLCLAVTGVDAARLRELSPAARIEILPDGVDLEAFRPMAPRDPARPLVVTTGDYSWGPTRDGLLFLVRDVWPRVRAMRKNAELAVVGRGAPLEISANDGILLRGRVEDVRREIANAAVFVSPTRIGSGIRIKILEAMAMERAVVSTHLGAEGIEAKSGRHLRLADSAEDLAADILSLLDDPVERNRLGTAAGALVRERYDWDTLGEELDALHRHIAARKPGTT